MVKRYFNSLLLCVFLALIFLSCKVTSVYQSPSINTSGLYRDTITSDPTNLASLPWSEVFTDTILQRLIREGIAQNLDLKIAYTRIQQSQAYYTQSRAAFYPTLDANSNESVSKLSKN